MEAIHSEINHRVRRHDILSYHQHEDVGILFTINIFMLTFAKQATQMQHM